MFFLMFGPFKALNLGCRPTGKLFNMTMPHHIVWDSAETVMENINYISQVISNH